MFPGKKPKIGRKGIIARMKDGGSTGGGTIGSAATRAGAGRPASDADEQNGPRYRNSEVSRGGNPGTIGSAQARTRASRPASDSDEDNGPKRTATAFATGGDGGGNSGEMKSAAARTRESRPASDAEGQKGPTWKGRYWGNNPPPDSYMTKAEARSSRGEMSSDEDENNGPIRAKHGGHVVGHKEPDADDRPGYKGPGDHDADDKVKAPRGGMVANPTARRAIVAKAPHPSAGARPMMRPPTAMARPPRVSPFSQSPVASGGPGVAGAPRGFGVQPGMVGAGYAKGGMALGGGGRSAALKSKLGKKPGIYNPGALAASIGRHKYGAAKMGKMAAAGRRRSESAG
ncbi:MAG: hypothetical protein KGL39_06950 [Patescibacteria group bacterium]|nr:hypothetical protein [Patescibacteria group bacterium]